MKRRLRALFLNSSLLFISLAVTALLCELAIRLVAPQQLIQIRPDLWQPADTVGWLHRPNVQTTINTGEGTVPVFTDARGFRVGRGGAPSGDVEVLLLGDSFIEALQVEYEESLAGRLQSRLPEATGLTVAVRNAGIDGWGPSHYYLRARSLLPQRQYGLLITAVFVGNDIQQRRMDYVAPREPAERQHFRLPRSLSRDELVAALLAPFNDSLETRSHLYILARTQMKTVRMKLGLTPLYLPGQYLRSAADDDRWDLIADLCADIDSVAREAQTPTLFVLIPANFQVDERIFDQYVRGFDLDPTTVDIDQPSRRMLAELQARGLEVIDVLEPFRAAQDSGARLYGTVDPHLSEEGHALLSEILAPVAARMIARDRNEIAG